MQQLHPVQYVVAGSPVRYRYNTGLWYCTVRKQLTFSDRANQTVWLVYLMEASWCEGEKGPRLCVHGGWSSHEACVVMGRDARLGFGRRWDVFWYGDRQGGRGTVGYKQSGGWSECEDLLGVLYQATVRDNDNL